MMNFFTKPSKQIGVFLIQRLVPVTHFDTITLTQRRYLLSNKVLVKEKPLLSTSQHGLCFSSDIKKQELSQKEKVISQVLSVFKDVDLRQLKGAPFPALVYGFGGIIPFVFTPIYFVVGSYSPFLVTTQLMYGATILAFVGGVKWGSAVAKNDISHFQIGLSTIPSLVAWSSLLVPEPVGILIVSTGLFSALYMDLLSSNYPQWFSALRVALTGVGVTSLLTTMIFYVLN